MSATMNLQNVKEESRGTNKRRHYTPMERILLLQILGKFEHIIEEKGNDAATLRDKDLAWANICEEYNNSSIVTEELKKCWKNIKHSQREILIKEQEERFPIDEDTETLEATQIKRMKNIIDQEKQLGQTKLSHEKTMAALKEEHLRAMNKLEIRAALARAEMAELLLIREQNI